MEDVALLIMNFDGFFLIRQCLALSFLVFLDAHTKFLAPLSNDWKLYCKYHSIKVVKSQKVFSL